MASFRKSGGGLGYGLRTSTGSFFSTTDLLIENLLHHMGFIVGTPFRTEQNAADSCTMVQLVLSKGIGSQVRRPDVVRTVNQPAGVLFRAGQSRLVAKPKMP